MTAATTAATTYLDLIVGAEADRRAATMELFKAAVEYKERWYHTLAERDRAGTTGPEPIPHPDEVIIDGWEVRIEGAVLQEEKKAQDFLHAMWPKYEQDLREAEKRLADDPNNPELLEQKKIFTDIVGWIRKDGARRNIRKILRESLRNTPKRDS